MLALVSLALLWGSFYYYSEYNQVAPKGTFLNGVSVSGLHRAEVEFLVERSSEALEQQTFTLLLSENGTEKKSFLFSLAELGLEYDASATVARVFDGSGYSAQADVLGVHAAADPVMTPVLKTDEIDWKKIWEIVHAHEKPVRNASLTFDEEAREWVFQEHQIGLALLPFDQDVFTDQLLSLAKQGFKESSLELVLERIYPEVLTEDLKPLYDRIQSMTDQTFQWKAGEELMSFSFVEFPEAILVDLKRRSVTIDEKVLREYFSQWADLYEQMPGKVMAREPVLQEKGHLKSDYEGDFVSGKVLDFDRIIERILTGEAPEDIPLLPFLFLEPEVELESFGKLTFLSRGRSSYALAHGEEREFNVRFGLSKYDGVVIPQGAEFDFNQVLGWVTYEAGWKPALAIFGGGGVKPVPGGGLCQVSTTMYRAVVNSGLPVTARKPHSLDVSYYQAYGYGIDSTVYPPEDINLKFVNDTPGPILIHTIMDEVNQEVFIEFYGIDDGREVELRQVVNREVVLPNQVSYTSELPAGIQEVLQRGRTGRYIEWEWTIKRADGSVEKKAIETLYPAAARTVRVGVGEGA